MIPVSEGPRYKVGKFDFSENKVVKSEALRSLFKVKEGQFYTEKNIRKGLENGDYDWAHMAMKYWPERVKARRLVLGLRAVLESASGGPP